MHSTKCRRTSPLEVDGLPAEFYVRFWNLLGPDLVQVYNSSFSYGMLPGSQRSGAIILLYKKGDILDTGNGVLLLYFVPITKLLLKLSQIAC